jgi:hypothetical protein
LRLDDGLADVGSLDGLESLTEGIKTGLRALSPVGIIGEGIVSGVIGTHGNSRDRVVASELKGVCDTGLDIVRNTVKML